MKYIITSVLALLITSVAFSQTEIKLEEVSKYVGQEVKVCGKVYGTKYLSDRNGAPTFINIGAKFPNAPLTVVIWGEDRAKFSEAPERLYDGKDLCITGKIKMYRDSYEIVIKEPSHITVYTK